MAVKKNFKNAVKGADKLFSINDITVAAHVEDIPDELTINQTFKDLIPPLSTEEYEQLESNLLENGIREPISIWRGAIIDGHNRHEIAKKHGLPFEVVSYGFGSESETVMWIIKNQLGRRNLSSYDRSILALRLKPVIAERAKQKQIEAGGPLLQISVEPVINTQKELATIAGVSHDTIYKVEKIESTAAPEVKAQLKRGEITINKAFQDIKREEKKQDSAAVVQAVPKLPSGKFNVLYIDPPYLAMSYYDLQALEIPAADDSVLFLWSAYPTLIDALDLINAWGFKYKSEIIWDKVDLSAGSWVRCQHETLLIGVKGNVKPPPKDVRVNSVHREKKERHLSRPLWFYEQIERMFPDGKYLEMFTNRKFSDKWEIWNNISTLSESGDEEE
jgi:N6-adenosine-specific RNA methylase IME4